MTVESAMLHLQNDLHVYVCIYIYIYKYKIDNIYKKNIKDTEDTKYSKYELWKIDI